MFDRFDVCDAYYQFARDFHRGQWSPEYAIFGRLDRLRYSPARSVADGGPSALSQNARLILSGLIRRQRAGDKAKGTQC